MIPNAAEILVDLMQMFRDKISAFLLASKLLALLLESNHKIKVIITHVYSNIPFYYISSIFLSISSFRNLVIILSIVRDWKVFNILLKGKPELKVVYNMFLNYHILKHCLNHMMDMMVFIINIIH